MKNSRAGLLVLLVKLGPKLLPLIKSLGDELMIFAKTFLGVGTAGTAAVSAGLYAYLFTWQTGLGLVAFLIAHEYGHVWAMRKAGVGSKGMYFIPFMGAVAIMDKLIHTARNEAFISIMGPVFGFALFVVPGYVWWYYTGSEAIAAITALCCFINLINLLPIMPLDGGRMLRSVSYTNNAAISLLFVAGISAVTAAGAWYAGFYLFAIMALIGFLELFSAFGLKEQTYRLVATAFRILGAFVFVKALELFNELLQEPNIPVFFPLLILVIPITLFVLFVVDILRLRERSEGILSTIVKYPWWVIREAFVGVVQLKSLRAEHIKPIDNYEPMVRNTKLMYASITISIGGVHFAVMYHLASTTTGALFADFLN